MSKYLTLESVLKQDTDKLTKLNRGEFMTDKLGLVPFCEIKQDEYKVLKKDCTKMVPDKKARGAYVEEMDDDRLMLKLVIAAVDREVTQQDARSNFTFANKDLLGKLGVVTAESAAAKLMTIGEIYKAATEIQEVCGFTDKVQEEEAEDIKN